MGRSTIEIDTHDPDELSGLIRTLGLVGMTVVGSKEADGAVALVIEGETVPDAPMVVISWETVTGQTTTQITVKCEVID